MESDAQMSLRDESTYCDGIKVEVNPARRGCEDDNRSRLIDSMARMRDKPRGVSRSDLVDRETRIFNDRRWADHDREDQQRREDQRERRELAAVTPRRSWWARLFGR